MYNQQQHCHYPNSTHVTQHQHHNQNQYNPQQPSSSYPSYNFQLTHHDKPTWPAFNEEDPFVDWLEMMLLTASTSPQHQHIIYTGTNGKRHFHANLIPQDNALLYKTIIDTLLREMAKTYKGAMRRTNNSFNGMDLLC